MKIRLLGAAAAACAMATAMAPTASAGPDPFLGEVAIYPFNFCPRGWAPADGQILPIAQNTALFSLYGTIYGGDGRTTFALPDLRGRVPVHYGQGPGLSNRRIGEKLGAETVTLTVPGMPAHTHGVPVAETVISSGDGSGRRGGRDRDDDDDDDDRRGGDHRGGGGSSDVTITTIATDGAGIGLVETTPTGANQTVSIMPPTAVVQYCVALQGIFPSRN